MNEKTFERQLIKEFRNHHAFAKKMSVTSVPGFPDIFVSKYNSTLLIETKYIFNNLNKKVKKLFTKNQIPFYMEYLKSKNDNLFFVFRADYCTSLEYAEYYIFKLNKTFLLLINDESVTLKQLLTIVKDKYVCHNYYDIVLTLLNNYTNI